MSGENGGGAARRLESFAWVTFAYLVALAVALWLAAGDTNERPLATLIAANVAATVILFAFGVRWDNASVFDPFWSVAPPLMALYWIGVGGEAVVLRQVVVAVLVFAWAIRLTYNWAVGWPGLHHEDWRYLDMYAKAPLPKWAISLFGIHLFPTLIVLLGSLSLIPALAGGGNAFGWLDCVALVVTGGAILVEATADEQMRRFARGKQPGDLMCEGLWAHSRHPNYFGELSFWWGLFLFGLAADGSYWWTIVGPLAMTAMFHFASVPMLDERSLARRPGYADYMQRVNALVPSLRIRL
jgi:steroid 5-alpha reductase family enzyme